MAVGTVGPIAQAVAEIAKIVGNWQNSAERRRMQAAIEAGEKYIQSNESTSITDKQKGALLKHYKKRFFKYN